MLVSLPTLLAIPLALSLTAETTMEAPSLRVQWNTPSSCPSAMEFEQMVLNLLGPEQQASLQQVSVHITEKANGRLQVQGNLVSTPQLERTMPIDFPDVPNCQKAVEAIILAMKTFHVPPPEKKDSPRTKPKLKWKVRIPIAAGFDSGRLDKSRGQASLRVGSAFQIPHLRLESALHYQGKEQQRFENSTLHSQTAFASVLACYPWEKEKFSLHVCTGPEIGLWHFGLKGLAITEIPTTLLWLTQTVGLRAWWKGQRDFAIGMSLEGWMAIRKHQGIGVEGLENIPPIPVERFGIRSQLIFEWAPFSKKRGNTPHQRESPSYLSHRL